MCRSPLANDNFLLVALQQSCAANGFHKNVPHFAFVSFIIFSNLSEGDSIGWGCRLAGVLDGSGRTLNWVTGWIPNTMRQDSGIGTARAASIVVFCYLLYIISSSFAYLHCQVESISCKFVLFRHTFAWFSRTISVLCSCHAWHLG